MSTTRTREGGQRRERSSLLLPGLLIGIGIGGLIDGILLHQILQWHHLISEEESVRTIAGLEANTLADGLFHALALVVTIVGVGLLYVRARRGLQTSPAVLAGWVLAGWGAFNMVEGVVDHYILQVHHVKPGPNEAIWDAAFLAFGAALFAIGWAIAARAGRGGEIEATVANEERRRAA